MFIINCEYVVYKKQLVDELIESEQEQNAIICKITAITDNGVTYCS